MKRIILSLLIFTISFTTIAQNTSASEQFTDWDNNGGWSNGTSPGAVTFFEDIEIDGSVVRIDDLDLNLGSVLTINTGDSLVVDGNLNVSSSSELIVEEGGYLYVNGNLVNEGSFIIFGDFTNDGIIAVSGNYIENGLGDLNTGTNSNFYVNGTSDDPGNTDGIIPPEIQAIYNTLPIELKSFEGILTQNKTTELKWITAKEENFSHFEIQRSINNQDFEVIGTVNGLGESNSDVYYSFNDKNVPYGIVRYRLNAVDIDESFELFEAIEIQNTFSSELKAFPNPVTDFSKLRIVVPQDLSGKLNKVALYDNAGSLLYSQTNYDPIDGKIEIENIKEGMYILKITHNGLTENLRIFKH
ncbi:T9SS type A sorting domain-containing protein [Marivirga arenosa]|uniref:T9SS type A sorting domain-containing protein n=1 Tax=Marivirga arenosa TaxID=3059076 RepID=A0AA51ZVA5_9BACT|nr:T9SS type A sorting domain-containing protein [Marivirga sp. BKB1-2]WNB17396.1 T9SS type A sorting domain-containing protein [Marivirga sp. BKB1-2]